MPGSLSSLLWLTLGAFAIGTEGFMIAGLLPHLARDLDVTVPAIGHLVTAFSLVYAIGAPTIAMLTAGLERRRLLAIAMAGFSIANLLAALAPSYAELLIARLLLALSAASFMPAASGYAAALGGPERRGRALSTVTNGLTLAIIAGVPLGVLVGESFGWRATFLSVAGLATLSLLGILVGMPSQPPVSTAGLGERLALAKRPDTMVILATSVLTVSATFTLYTYLGVFLADVAGIRPQGLALVLFGFGVASAAGTRLGGTAADHWGADHAVIAGGGLTVLAYLVLSLGAALEPARAMRVMLPAILLWGLASWGLMTAQQARLVALSPALAAVSVSLNSSATYLGSATGAVIGALVIAHGGVDRLGWVAAAFGLAALLSVLASGSASPPRG
ncbi:MFS transporter [Bradyrhizobium japonicum]|uniref:MFS transporter n=1 Tax=Bradyrhizobium japonicum TaxID=375 RepID=UPI001BA87DEC|nr:MFS transporter [Bradyrhizobium japonicum]MBR0735017.1 MFS transporter [Bradyrhizobium japonicum]MBR0809492.1 MFS transporter [Bradyrhizobium japonicum]